jgi:hypothetical protein
VIGDFCEACKEKAAELISRIEAIEQQLQPKPRKPRLPKIEEANWVSLKKIFGKSKIPADAAEVVKIAVAKMIARGDVSETNKWQSLEWLAANYNAEVE